MYLFPHCQKKNGVNIADLLKQRVNPFANHLTPI